MITIIVTVIIFLVLIALHEFGHFIMAKLSGVFVHEFSIGMGPAIFKKQGKETLYTIRLLPIGGYCKLEGEDEESDNKRAFCNQKLYKRILVVISGALFNIILGFLLFILITAVMPRATGEKNMIVTPVIESVVKNSYLEKAGVMPGDEIVKINSHKIHFYEDIALYTNEFKENEPIEIVVKRDNKKYSYTILPTVNEIIYNYKPEHVEVITKINEEQSVEILEYNKDFQEEINKLIGKTQNEKRLILGFRPKSEAAGFFNTIKYAYHMTGYVVRMVYKAFWDMLTLKTGLEQLSGPVGIVGAVNDAVNTGAYSLVNVLFLMAVITINLGVFNLLPIPALDGARLVFLIIELITRKKISAQKEGMIHTIGLILLLLLGVFIAYSDVMKLIR